MSKRGYLKKKYGAWASSSKGSGKKEYTPPAPWDDVFNKRVVTCKEIGEKRRPVEDKIYGGKKKYERGTGGQGLHHVERFDDLWT